MTGDAAQEELMFLVKPELMVAMAICNRMVDTEVVCVSGARKYAVTSGFGQSFELVGPASVPLGDNAPGPKVAAIDAIRGGGPAMTKPALLRDMNKARIAFEAAREVATGHWGCGAFGNNHNLMFLKQWLAASEAGVQKVHYHDFSRDQSHHIFPLVRKLKHLNVGELWEFLLHLTGDLESHNVAAFCVRIADVCVGRIAVPASGGAPLANLAPPPLEAPQAGARAAAPQYTLAEPTITFSLAELQAGTPAGVTASKKEEFLSATDFESPQAFGMSKADFARLPRWKRDAAKKKLGLF